MTWAFLLLPSPLRLKPKRKKVCFKFNHENNTKLAIILQTVKLNHCSQDKLGSQESEDIFKQ